VYDISNSMLLSGVSMMIGYKDDDDRVRTIIDYDDVVRGENNE